MNELFVQVFVLMQFDQGMEYRPTWGEGEWEDGVNCLKDKY